MRKVILAESAGFCYGVSRSMEITEAALKASECCSLGEIIHNRDVMDRLAASGLKAAAKAADIPPGSKVIIRAHGAAKAEYDELSAKGCELCDATCPFVEKIHAIARDASERGRTVAVVGAADHDEVRGICGWCSSHIVFSCAADIEKWLDENPDARGLPLTIVSQTTQTAGNYSECKNLLKNMCTNTESFDTICFATSTRQKEAVSLAEKCDAMVVIGGKHSANSVHLAELCAEKCANTQFIENADQLDLKCLEGAATIGVTAGASAPEWIIKEVLETMSDEIVVSENPVESVPAVEEKETVEEPVTAEEPAAEESREAAEEPVDAAAPETEESEPAPPVEKSFDEMLEDSLKTIYNGDRVSGTVVAVTATEISVDLGAKYSAFIPSEELTEGSDKELAELVKVGDPIEAIVVRVNDVEGIIQLSKKRLDAVKNWADIEAAHADGTVVEGVVTEINKGGLVVSVRGIRVFVPASHSGMPRDADMSELLKQKVRLKITEVNKNRRRVVGSIRAVLQRERRERAEAVWNGIEVGKEYEGVVKSLTSYGAFVDIGGVDGMVHVSELSWNRIRQPSDVVAVGDNLKVHVIGFDKEAHRISLGCRRAEDNPWNKFTAAFSVGDVAHVKIVKLMSFGAFAEVLPGVDGLIHISQIANRRIGQPSEALKVGEEVDAKITAIDGEKQKISLSIRALSEREPAKQAAEKDPEPAEDALVYEVDADGTASGNVPEEETPEE